MEASGNCTSLSSIEISPSSGVIGRGGTFSFFLIDLQFSMVFSKDKPSAFD